MDAAEQFHDDIDDIPEKDLLLEIMIELKTIRHGLQTGEFGHYETDERDDPTRYECAMCNDVVRAEKREQHMMDKHNAPAGLSLENNFSEV